MLETFLLFLLTLGQTVVISGHVRTADGKGVEGIKVVAVRLGDLNFDSTVDLRDVRILQNEIESLGLGFWAQMSGQMMGPG